MVDGISFTPRYGLPKLVHIKHITTFSTKQ